MFWHRFSKAQDRTSDSDRGRFMSPPVTSNRIQAFLCPFLLGWRMGHRRSGSVANSDLAQFRDCRRFDLAHALATHI